ncbi:hypothetical protein VB773_19720 [Haloarculaceae archaeon H-GB2-1]|nr:hypothetical protein [Haloarculaceae archaeon H-GB2-1]
MLTEEYSLDEDTAETLIGLIKGDPRLAARRPETRKELEQTVAQLEQVLEEIDFTEFDDTDDGQALQDDLITAVKTDFGLIEDPQQLITKAVTSSGDERARAVEVLGFVAAEKSDETFEELTISRNAVAPLARHVQRTEGDECKRAARALGEAVAAGESNTTELAKDQLRERVEQTTGQTRQAAAQALGNLQATSEKSPTQTDSIGEETPLGTSQRGSQLSSNTEKNRPANLRNGLRKP